MLLRLFAETLSWLNGAPTLLEKVSCCRLDQSPRLHLATCNSD